ncbi:ribulose-phosphate 3-epimerase [Listeria seeligeri]|uniref:Ribulose-phosphate 3-epimerase n=1 Tax=Listeria seeligeri TaxID=1640 RepID=A0A7T0Q8C0_LISSE|nr:ribulose-phosphate 3-epimerase [Listeria seeligeri]EAE1273831.1 ribulose-phosphate 3-epimerase [Listeria monocytogenes]MBF2643078.1 ribulose-phosphate 3-epimerase [Listeria seeligeri]QPJ28033.1 ribulose-phosphate 3-epimerase [Listeria seeligeri]QPL19379.1 ribulose-phosphate 3-epimerase [Listeria seeligeri]
MKNILLCPSMMCANFSNLKEEVRLLDNAGADIFHMDIMDGSFVPNFGMGLQDFELVRRVTKKTVDVHLMIENPCNYVEKFADMGADIIYIHPESDKQPARTLDIIQNKGKKAGIAINPSTSIESVQELFPLIDYLMVMTVNPGFAGQKYLDYVTSKIKKINSLKDDFHFEIMVDGAISPEKIQELRLLGVKGFILGTSALFGKEESYERILQNLKGGGSK